MGATLIEERTKVSVAPVEGGFAHTWAEPNETAGATMAVKDVLSRGGDTLSPEAQASLVDQMNTRLAGVEGEWVDRGRTSKPANETAGAEIVGKPIHLEAVNEAARLFPLIGERVLPDLGLLPEHVAVHRLDGDSVVIVTRGGSKLRWPDDIARARALTQSQKDGQFPGGVNPNSKPWNAPREEPKG
jgi:hypothetical protein